MKMHFLVFKASIIGYKDIKITTGDDIELTCKVEQVYNSIPSNNIQYHKIVVTYYINWLVFVHFRPKNLQRRLYGI